MIPSSFSILGAVHHHANNEYFKTLSDTEVDMTQYLLHIFDAFKNPHPWFIGIFTDIPNGNKVIQQGIQTDKRARVI